MIRLMGKKLKQKKGETLIEALVSILIVVLAMGLLSTSVIASARINAANLEADKKYNEDLMRAETFQEDTDYPANDIKMNITFSKEGMQSQSVYVKLYGGENGEFGAYDYGDDEAEVEP